MKKKTGTGVVAILPVRERDVKKGNEWVAIRGKRLLDYTIEAAKRAKRIDRIVVTTESKAVADYAKTLGADAPFLRPAELAGSNVGLIDVIQDCLQRLSNDGGEPACVVLLEVTHPLRPEGLIDRVIETLESEELDTVFTVFESHQVFWRVDQSGNLTRVQSDAEGSPRALRAPFFGQIQGLVCATTPATIKRGAIIGERVGVVPVRGLLGLLDVKEEEGIRLAEFLVRPT